MESNVSLKVGTVSGTLLSIAPTLLSQDIVNTVILGTIGATVSFIVTLFLKWLVGRKSKVLKTEDERKRF